MMFLLRNTRFALNGIRFFIGTDSWSMGDQTLNTFYNKITNRELIVFYN